MTYSHINHHRANSVSATTWRRKVLTMRDIKLTALTYGRHKEHTVSVRSIALSPLHSFSRFGDTSANYVLTYTLFRSRKKSLLDVVQSFVSTLF